jgi:hypothetical protein
MPIQLSAPLYKTFTLVRTDRRYNNDGDPTTVTVKQARQHEHAARAEAFKRLERAWSAGESPDDVRLIQEVSMVEVWREEAWYTLVECNLLGPNGDVLFPSTKDQQGHPRLAFKNKQEFYEAWGQLFPDIAEEIVEKIHEVNSLWGGPSGEGR